MEFLETLNKEDFLKNYWEQRPLVIKNALSSPEKLIQLGDLFQMAQDDYYESRAVSFRDNQWQVMDGPFTVDDFQDTSLNWTLINHNLELYLENVLEIKKQLNFLPNWLFDDAMSTYSTKGSSVGAHIDNYNVFILQVSGSRRWDIQHNPKTDFQPDLPVRILKEFDPDESFTLNPGDLIYIPPHVAHHGVTLEQSLSLSLGYKSLEDKKLLDQLGLDLLNEFESDDFYKTSFNKVCDEAYNLDSENMAKLEDRLINILKEKKVLQKSILKFSSRTKRATELNELDQKEFFEKFANTPLYKDEFTRFATIKQDNDFLVAINEELYQLPLTPYEMVIKVAESTSQDPIIYEAVKEFKSIVHEWYQKGYVFFNEED